MSGTQKLSLLSIKSLFYEHVLFFNPTLVSFYSELLCADYHSIKKFNIVCNLENKTYNTKLRGLKTITLMKQKKFILIEII